MFIIDRANIFKPNFPTHCEFATAGSLWCTFYDPAQAARIAKAGFEVCTETGRYTATTYIPNVIH